MQIRWLEEAIFDLQQIKKYIDQEKPRVASEISKKIFLRVNLLKDQPNLGRAGRVSYTRELIIGGTPYIVPYRVKNNRIEILRVLNSSRVWPENL